MNCRSDTGAERAPFAAANLTRAVGRRLARFCHVPYCHCGTTISTFSATDVFGLLRLADTNKVSSSINLIDSGRANHVASAAFQCLVQAILNYARAVLLFGSFSAARISGPCLEAVRSDKVWPGMWARSLRFRARSRAACLHRWLYDTSVQNRATWAMNCNGDTSIMSDGTEGQFMKWIRAQPSTSWRKLNIELFQIFGRKDVFASSGTAQRQVVGENQYDPVPPRFSEGIGVAHVVHLACGAMPPQNSLPHKFSQHGFDRRFCSRGRRFPFEGDFVACHACLYSNEIDIDAEPSQLGHGQFHCAADIDGS